MRKGSTAEIAKGSKLVFRVVYATNKGILIGGTPSGLLDIFAHDVVQMEKRVFSDSGHKHVTSFLNGRVERDRQSKLLRLVCKALNHWNNTAGRNRKMTCANTKTVRGIEKPQRFKSTVIVHEGLSLPHKDNA